MQGVLCCNWMCRWRHACPRTPPHLGLDRHYRALVRCSRRAAVRSIAVLQAAAAVAGVIHHLASFCILAIIVIITITSLRAISRQHHRHRPHPAAHVCRSVRLPLAQGAATNVGCVAQAIQYLLARAAGVSFIHIFLN